MTKAKQAERDEAIAKLREIVKPGDTVQTILRHCSRSGMTRAISPVVQGEDVSWLVARATGDKVNQTHGGITMGGCGMDMGFALVYGLSRTLYPDGYECIGQGDDAWHGRCPSNDHSNDYGEKQRGTFRPVTKDGADAPEWGGGRWHRDGGYALQHRWL